MNFKHVLISFLALMLLPVAATAQFNGPYTPALGTAMIVVTKTFEDGNTESDATFYVSCTSGTVTPVVKTLSADANG